MSHRRCLWDGLQIPASSLLSWGVARAKVVRLTVGVASVDLMQSSVFPGADTVEARVAGLGGDQGLRGRGGALGGWGVSRQRRHGVCLGLGEGQPVVWAVGAASQPTVELTKGEVSENVIGPPRRMTVQLKRKIQLIIFKFRICTNTDKNFKKEDTCLGKFFGSISSVL